MSMNNNRLRAPLKTARGLGSAKDGTHHFVLQRITAVALVFLSLYVVGLVVSLIGDDYLAVRNTVAHPCNAVLLIAFLVSMFWHSKLGMQVIIEDYVHDEGIKLVLIMANTFFAVAVALASAFAILTLSFKV